MKITDSFAASVVKVKDWLKSNLTSAAKEIPEFNKLKNEVQASEHNLARFDFADITDAHSLSKNIEDYVALRSTHMHLLGRLEGNLNVNLDGIDVRMRAYAYSLRNIVVHHCRLLEVKVDAEIKEIDVISAIGGELQVELKNSKQYLDGLNTDQKQYPSNFSQPMGWFYTIASFLLLVADFPLSFLAMENLLPPPTRVSWGWAKWIVSIGVTLIPLFIKLFFDKYIIRHSQSQSQQITSTVRERLKQAPELVFSFSILWFVFVNLFVLGYARHFFIHSDEIVMSNTAPSIGNNSAPVNIHLYFSGLLTNPERNTVQFVALLFLSVLFPVLSGVFLSYGLFYLKNSHNIQKMKRDIIRMTERVTFLSKEKARKEGEKGVIANRIAQWTEGGEGSLTQLYYMSFSEDYKRGYVLYNGDSSSRYHIMYRKYLRHFTISQFTKPALVLVGILLLGNCNPTEKVKENSSGPNARAIDSVSSADVKVLCDFTTNKTSMMIERRHSIDTLPQVLKYSYSILKYCFDAHQPGNQATFHAVLQTNSNNQLARFTYPAIPQEASKIELKKVLNTVNLAYEQLATQTYSYLRDSAKSTCLINSILGLQPDIQANASINKAHGKIIKIVLLSDRLEVCNGVMLESRPAASRDIAAFDKAFKTREIPNFKNLGVEFIFITIGYSQEKEKVAADKFWRHVLLRFGYSREEADTMCLARTEIPDDIFPTSENRD